MANLETCGVCNTKLPVDGTACISCLEPIGFPNIRLARKEQQQLYNRYETALDSVKLRGIDNIVAQFEHAVENANIIMVRSLSQLIPLVDNENTLISTFHHQVGSGARIAENNAYDPKRDSVESIAHPLYYKEINYAALSLNSAGVNHYGDVHLQLNDTYIRKRTSFFQENPFVLIEKLGLMAGETLPEGYRSTWDDRGKLAVCKCHANLHTTSTIDDFQNVLLNQDTADFIEANIYGNINAHCIEKVTLLDSASTQSKVLFNCYKKKFTALGIEVGIEVEVKI